MKTSVRVARGSYWKLVFSIVLFCLIDLSFAENGLSILTTPQLVLSGLKALPYCSHYRVVGDCLWLECGFGGCYKNHTALVQHAVPEFVVLVYPDYHQIPWKEYQLLQKTVEAGVSNWYRSQVGLEATEGHLKGHGSGLQETMLFEAAVVGHPALSSLPSYLLRGRASPLYPYFNSLVDAVQWRNEVLEHHLSELYFTNPANYVGPLYADFGSVYPRSGFVMQSDSTKAAATIAVRALNLVTGLSLPHIVQPLGPCMYENCDAAPPIDGAGEKTWYQSLIPFSSLQCNEKFPDLQLIEQQEVFAWAIWREYRACLPGSGKFLGSLSF